MSETLESRPKIPATLGDVIDNHYVHEELYRLYHADQNSGNYEEFVAEQQELFKNQWYGEHEPTQHDFLDRLQNDRNIATIRNNTHANLHLVAEQAA